MKILLVSNNYTPYNGGVVSSIQTLVMQLQRLGHEVRLITFGFLQDHNDPDWVDRMYCPIRFMYKKNHMVIPWRPKRSMRYLIETFQPDIIHVHHPFLLGPIAQRLAKQKNIPVIFTYHTIYEAYAHYVPLPIMLVQWYITRSVRAFCAIVDGIIAPSNYIKYRITSLAVHTTTVVIPSGILPVYVHNHLHKRQLHKPIKMLIVSRMVKEKNITAVLQVASELIKQQIPFHLTLMGYGSDYVFLQNYAYNFLRLPIQQVTFVHKPSKDAISQAYKDTDLFLFTSSTDTQGLVLAEAMAAGTPVIALDGPGQRDIIKHGINGYIVHSQEQMICYIKKLIHHSSLWEKLSKNAYETALRYHPSTVIREYIAFCNLMCNKAALKKY